MSDESDWHFQQTCHYFAFVILVAIIVFFVHAELGELVASPLGRPNFTEDSSAAPISPALPQNTSRPFPLAEIVLDKISNLNEVFQDASEVAVVECDPEQWYSSATKFRNFECGFSEQYFPLCKELVLRGARFIDAPWGKFSAVGPKCCGPDNCVNVSRPRPGPRVFHWRGKCQKHMVWIQENIFDKCPTCKWFHFSPSCTRLWATSALMNRTQRIIIGPMMKVEWCQGARYDSRYQLGIANADIILVLSERAKYVCPKIAEKMMIIGENPCSRADIENMNALLEKRWNKIRERERERGTE